MKNEHSIKHENLNSLHGLLSFPSKQADSNNQDVLKPQKLSIVLLHTVGRDSLEVNGIFITIKTCTNFVVTFSPYYKMRPTKVSSYNSCLSMEGVVISFQQCLLSCCPLSIDLPSCKKKIPVRFHSKISKHTVMYFYFLLKY